MVRDPKQKRGTPNRTGKRTVQINSYYSRRRALNKLRRILRSNGVEAAREWARKYDATHVLVSLSRSPTRVGILAKKALGRS